MKFDVRNPIPNLILSAVLAATLGACGLGGSSRGADGKTQDQKIASVMMKAADRSRRGGDVRSAAAFYQRALNIDPKLTEALIGLGESYAAAGIHKEAVKAFRKAIAAEPNNTRARRGLGNVLVGQDQAALAVYEFQKILAVDAKDFRAYNGLGVAHDSLGKHSKAQEYYYAGLEIVPGDVNLRSNLGLSLAFAGHFDGAVDVLRPLALRSGATARDRQNLALAYGLSGEVDKATRFARMDMDSQAVERNLGYYAALRSMTDPVLRVKSVRAGYALQSR